MQQDKDDIDLDRQLSEMAGHIASIPAIREQTRRRIAQASMKLSPRRAVLLATLAIVLVLAAILTHPKREATPRIAFRSTVPISYMEMDGVTIQEHFAGVIDSRIILIGWSYRGGRAIALPDPNGQYVRVHRDGFTEIPVRSVMERDGRTFCWSVFIADSDDPQLAEPPTLRVQADARQIGFGTSPRRYSASDLAAAVASVERECGASVDLAEIHGMALQMR